MLLRTKLIFSSKNTEKWKEGYSHYIDEETEAQGGYMMIQREMTQPAETGLVAFSLHHTAF